MVCFWLSSWNHNCSAIHFPSCFVLCNYAVKEKRLLLTSSLTHCWSSTGLEIVACLPTPAHAFETQCHSCMLQCGDLHRSVFLYWYVSLSVLQAEILCLSSLPLVKVRVSTLLLTPSKLPPLSKISYYNFLFLLFCTLPAYISKAYVCDALGLHFDRSVWVLFVWPIFVVLFFQFIVSMFPPSTCSSVHSLHAIAELLNLPLLYHLWLSTTFLLYTWDFTLLLFRVFITEVCCSQSHNSICVLVECL